MKFGAIPTENAAGSILAHKLVDAEGGKLLGKGTLLTAQHIALLQEHGYANVIVATLEAADVHEDEAARRIGVAVAGYGVRVTTPGVGRANVIAAETGVLRVNVTALEKLNNIDMGITIATRREHTLVRNGELVALVKIVPFGIAAARVMDVETMVRTTAPILAVDRLQPSSVALIVSGPASARDDLLAAFTEPVRCRIQALDSRLDEVVYVSHTPEALAEAIASQHAAGRSLVLIAGISAIMDRDDVVPTALRLAGGTMTHLGVPVDPGSLLMLGYVETMPVIGAPGCIRSLKTNVIDHILPRLMAGERLSRADLVALGHGGLLDDIRERPMPRDSDLQSPESGDDR
jgi:molybdenum cofactor cytidylyltransferase